MKWLRQHEVKAKVNGVESVVARVDVPVYETVAELVAAVGEVAVVDNYNRQNKQDIANKARVAATQGPGKAAQRAKALAWLTTPANVHLLVEVAGDQTKLDALLDKTIGQLFPTKTDELDSDAGK